MPHNRTRIWAGLAILAVTIPAIGQFYYSSATHDKNGSPIAGFANLESRQQDSFGSGRIALRQTERDYQAELDAALAKAGAKNPSLQPYVVQVPIFSDSPLVLDQVPIPAATPSVSETSGETPNDDTPVASTRVISTSAPINDGGADDGTDDSGLSDRAVYQIVVNNLQPDDRDTFVRSWALMTPEQRADMLDEFRANLQSNP